MIFLEYSKCKTCQKAKRWLDMRGFVYTDRPIKEQKPSFEELKLWSEKSGLPVRRFFNTSGLLYKSLNLKDKLPNMTEEECLRLLATDGMLVKRPILVTESQILVGFRAEEWEAVL